MIALVAGGAGVAVYLIRSFEGGGGSIGVVEIQGVISNPAPIVDTLDSFQKSSKIKAIVLRIDSPGGGVAATQEIYQEIRKVRKTKKVIASMGSMAASGGLYVAVAADQVVANPATVTGSIGVIMQMVNVEDLLAKVGLSPVVIKSGRYKDIGSSARPMTEEERTLLQHIVDEMHRQFIDDVARGRGMEHQEVSRIADGRIFTGREALKLGLIDRIGNFKDAVKLAAKLSGLKGSPKLIFPRKKDTWWKELLSGKNPLELRILPQWTRTPLSFQYLYLPGF